MLDVIYRINCIGSVVGKFKDETLKDHAYKQALEKLLIVLENDITEGSRSMFAEGYRTAINDIVNEIKKLLDIS